MAVQVRIHDFRVCDRVLAETEPDAGDVVFLGAHGTTAFPFLVVRRIGGPGGTYIDALDIVDADGKSLGVWERTFELDGESKPSTLVNEMRGVRFPAQGTYTLQYSIFDDVVANFPFRVVQREAPSAGIVSGPLDAALAKSTIAWLTVENGAPITKPVWYGYDDGRLYVLVGEGEQDVPGLLEANSAKVLARSKDKRSLVAEAECVVSRLPKDAEWERIARDLLVGRRLNLKDGDAAVGRWKQTCEIVALTPLMPAGDAMPEDAE